MSISDKQDDSNEAGKLLKHLTEGLHHWKKRWLFHLLHYFIASYALPDRPGKAKSRTWEVQARPWEARARPWKALSRSREASAKPRKA